TQQSADRLQLTGGKDVLALIKAPWVAVTPQTVSTPEHDNVLSGRISHLQPGQTQSEVLVTLEGGEVVCATLANDDETRQGLQPEMAVYASFNADQVIIATLC
uniref:TOBE domain-containing protein n=1 Tax=Dickeya lacustris TaxID=2259638 RepID=UPI0013DE1CD4